MLIERGFFQDEACEPLDAWQASPEWVQAPCTPEPFGAYALNAAVRWVIEHKCVPLHAADDDPVKPGLWRAPEDG